MAKFLIQTDNTDLGIEISIIEELIKRDKILHSYLGISANDFMDIKQRSSNPQSFKSYIPIGDINFVTSFLNVFYNIKKENPIEVPKYLRKDRFLKREYNIIKAKDLPRNGNYFIKDADTLKSFSYNGYLDHLNIDELVSENTNKNNLSVHIKPDTNMIVSSIFDIQSEYRVYVINNNIEAISNYNGDCTIFPDINLVKQMTQLIEYNDGWLKSYTLDIMVGKEGTAIIEVHNFTSVGLYNTLWGNNLLSAYKQGLEYLIYDNHKIEV